MRPTFTTYEGDDPDGFVLSANVHRRHMTKGAIAMAVARVLSATDNPQTDAARASGVGQPKVSMALTVLTFAPELADVVLAGGSLDEAYTTARKRPEQAVT